MSVVYSSAVKTARMNADATYFVNGQLQLLNSTGAVLAAFLLTGTAGSVTGSVWTLGFGAQTVNASAAGTATQAQIINSAGTPGITGLTVGTTGTDIVLNNPSIATGQSITLSSATVTHA